MPVRLIVQGTINRIGSTRRSRPGTIDRTPRPKLRSIIQGTVRIPLGV